MPRTAPKLVTSGHPWRAFTLALLLTSMTVGCFKDPRGTIGAILVREASGKTVVRDVPKHLAAFEAGVRKGDELLFIDGRQVAELSDGELQTLLAGTVGEEVQLTLVRGGGHILRVT